MRAYEREKKDSLKENILNDQRITNLNTNINNIKLMNHARKQSNDNRS